MDFERKDKYDIQDLIHIVRILREPGGCPWDQEQTHQSIRKNLIEETYEVAEAIDMADAHLLEEELGDLLLQILLHTRMEEEKGSFTFSDVCNTLAQKLVYRHPHVFGQTEVAGSAEVLRNWETLKNKEKGRTTAAHRLDSVPASLPALMRAEKVQKRAAEFGFSYANAAQALADLESEVAELREALAQQGDAPLGKAAQETGDVLFSATNVARLLNADAEEALTQSLNRFAGRVKLCEEMALQEGTHLADTTATQRDTLWKRAKARQKNHLESVPTEGSL